MSSKNKDKTFLRIVNDGLKIHLIQTIKVKKTVSNMIINNLINVKLLTL